MVSEEILSLERKYKNQSNVRIGRDFIQPCLKECKKYRRGTGTFSSSAFKSYINAIDHFIDDDIKIEILCSPKIDPRLYETLKNCHSDNDRDEVMQELTNNIAKIAVGFKDNPKDLDYRSLLIAYLITNKKLEIKIAQPLNYRAIRVCKESAIDDEDPDMDDVNTRAMYHIKYGYFEFEDDIKVAFEGSVNETDTAFNMNSEKATVFRSWKSEDIERMEDIIDDLDNDWNGKNNDIKLYEIDDETLKVIGEHIQKHTKGKRPKKIFIDKPVNPPVNIEDDSQIRLRPYQSEAIKKWEANNYQGLFSMATGTGKTLTAIAAIKKIMAMEPGALVVLTVPLVTLADQWKAELSKFNIKTISAYTGHNDWKDKLNHEGMQFSVDKNYNAPLIVAVNQTFNSDVFQSQIEELSSSSETINKLIIVDECHHFNKSNLITKLPELFNMRIGLSATPFNQFDDEYDSKFLLEYFRKEVIEFTLDEAIPEFLTPYNYYIVQVALNDDETEALEKIHKELGGIAQAIKKDSSYQKRLDQLNGQKKRLLSSVEDKLLKLGSLIKKHGDKKNNALAYCGASSLVDEQGDRKRIIQKVSKIFDDNNWSVGRITSDEGPNHRIDNIEDLKNGQLDVIVSIKILDEGIDIPSCRTAYILASSRSNREWVQRRGRVLRQFKNKEYADIYDFVITDATIKSVAVEKLIEDEFERVKEFAKSAKNKEDIYAQYKERIDG